MTDYQNWLDRVDNLLQMQSYLGHDLMSANFTRRELIELKMMIEVLMEKESESSSENPNKWIPVSEKKKESEENHV